MTDTKKPIDDSGLFYGSMSQFYRDILGVLCFLGALCAMWGFLYIYINAVTDNPSGLSAQFAFPSAIVLLILTVFLLYISTQFWGPKTNEN